MMLQRMVSEDAQVRAAGRNPRKENNVTLRWGLRANVIQIATELTSKALSLNLTLVVFAAHMSQIFLFSSSSGHFVHLVEGGTVRVQPNLCSSRSLSRVFHSKTLAIIKELLSSLHANFLVSKTIIGYGDHGIRNSLLRVYHVLHAGSHTTPTITPSIKTHPEC